MRVSASWDDPRSVASGATARHDVTKKHEAHEEPLVLGFFVFFANFVTFVMIR
jgi:hypothetical protein